MTPDEHIEYGGRLGMTTEAQFLAMLYVAFEQLGANHVLLSIVGSWRDTMPDEWCIKALRRYLNGEPI